MLIVYTIPYHTMPYRTTFPLRVVPCVSASQLDVLRMSKTLHASDQCLVAFDLYNASDHAVSLHYGTNCQALQYVWKCILLCSIVLYCIVLYCIYTSYIAVLYVVELRTNHSPGMV